jgi:pSer/pThr/pTyr-binding forkhead associated (FHA) protein
MRDSPPVSRVYLEYQGDSIELPVGETVIGRDITCALRFNDPSVSRRHLRFVRRADEVFVQDLGSTNGTTLNDKALSGPMLVEDGDALALGNRRVIVRVGESDERPEDTLSLKNMNVPRELEKIRAATTRIAVTVPPPVAAAAEAAISHRRHQRQPFSLQLVYVSEELEIEATTRDLSMSGVFVCTQVLDPVGTRCQLAILIDGGPPLRLGAVVRRVVEHDPYGGMGVEFENVGAAERAWLEKTIERLAGDSAA